MILHKMKINQFANLDTLVSRIMNEFPDFRILKQNNFTIIYKKKSFTVEIQKTVNNELKVKFTSILLEIISSFPIIGIVAINLKGFLQTTIVSISGVCLLWILVNLFNPKLLKFINIKLFPEYDRFINELESFK